MYPTILRCSSFGSISSFLFVLHSTSLEPSCPFVQFPRSFGTPNGLRAAQSARQSTLFWYFILTSPPIWSVRIFVSTRSPWSSGSISIYSPRRCLWTYPIYVYLPSTSKGSCPTTIPPRSSAISHSHNHFTSSRLLRSSSILVCASRAIFLCIAFVFDFGSDGGLHPLGLLFGPFRSVCFLEIYDRVEKEHGQGVEAEK